MALRSASAFILCFLFLSSVTHAKYQEGDLVTLWVNVVGPYKNPQETYSFYSLPYCRPSGNVSASKSEHGLGILVGGNKLIDSQIQIRFKRDIHRIPICEVKLDATKVKSFKDAIENFYIFELYLDELPLWGMVGLVHPHMNNDGQYAVYTHWHLEIKYNGDQIVLLKFIQENPKPLQEGGLLNMTYSVDWNPTDINFADRFDVYLDHSWFEHQIHWFSILNSLVAVIFLAAFVSKIFMRTLCDDEDGKYTHAEDDLGLLEKETSEESGWKLLHGDVFRPPRHPVLLSAVVGTGAQLVILAFLFIIFATFGRLYMWRGVLTKAFLCCYVLTSFISGYTSGAMYSRYGGEKWKKAMILTALAFPSMCFGIGSILKTIAVSYGSVAIPSDTMVVAFAVWVLLSLPFVVVGTFVGRNLSGEPNDPCRTNTIPRPIPEKKFYLKPSIISLVGGILPFGSILVEIYYVHTSLWNYRVYYLYGVLLLAFILLIVVTVCVAISGTYLMLNAENHHWQWTSFLAGASVAIYIFLYSIYYYHVKTRMSGLLQTSIYFGYTIMFSVCMGILCGAVGYLASNLFVRRIYSNIKCE